MNVQTTGGNLFIKWHHIRSIKGVDTIGSLIESSKTTCIVVNDTEGSKATMVGFSFCDPRDNFSKEVGRKLSLQRAISNLNKEDRKTIWQAYLNRKDKVNEHDKKDN